MAKTAKRHKTPPPEEKRCVAIKPSGERCKSAKLSGTSFCRYHTMGEAKRCQEKSRVAISEREAKIAKSCEVLPLLSPEKQARYLNHKIEEEDAGDNRASVICRYMDMLIRVTESAGASGGVAHTLTLVIPERPLNG